MPRLGSSVKSESGVLGNLLTDARDVFRRERYEQRIDFQLAVLTQFFHKNKTVDPTQVNIIVNDFIKAVDPILRELEDAKRKGQEEESKNIDKIKQLLAKGTKVNSRKFKGELQKFGEKLKKNTVSGLRQHTRKERRLRRGRAPMGYFLKKVRTNQSLDRDIARRTGHLVEDTQHEHELSIDAGNLIEALKLKPNDKYKDWDIVFDGVGGISCVEWSDINKKELSIGLMKTCKWFGKFNINDILAMKIFKSYFQYNKHLKNDEDIILDFIEYLN